MIRVLLITLFLFISIQARENPFFPSLGEKDIPYTSNKNQEIPKLKRATISLPPQARVIKKVTIEYENLDASLDTKTIELENSVDWHLPVFISQSYAQKQSLQENTQKKKVIEQKKAPEYKEVAKIEFAKFYVQDKSLKIVTNDKQLRNFLLVQPHRIVIDFHRDSSMKSYLKKIENSIFTKVRIGNHDGYYRVVIELDGYYRYKLKKLSNGCLITLR
ncbi:AMIN domain-containing protein [Sulfurimonas sp.]